MVECGNCWVFEEYKTSIRWRFSDEHPHFPHTMYRDRESNNLVLREFGQQNSGAIIVGANGWVALSHIQSDEPKLIFVFRRSSAPKFHDFLDMMRELCPNLQVVPGADHTQHSTLIIDDPQDVAAFKLRYLS